MYKAAEASSAARVCGHKRLGVVNNGKKVTPWLKQKKMLFKQRK